MSLNEHVRTTKLIAALFRNGLNGNTGTRVFLGSHEKCSIATVSRNVVEC